MYATFFSYGPLFWLCIFLFVSAVTVFTILFRILKVARVNPVEVVKSE